MKPSQWIIRGRRVLIGVGLIGVLAILVHALSRPSIRLDGVGYYAPLASLVFDRDLDLRNEVMNVPMWMRRAYFTSKSDGRIVDPYAVGAAFLWAPAILIARAFDPAAPAHVEPSRRRWDTAGFEPRYVRTIAFATGLEALLGCLLLYVAARASTDPRAAAWGVTGAALGTPLVYYALSDPSYAHTASFLAVAALLAAVLAHRRFPLWGLGALWGLVTIVRWQDGVLGLVLVPRLLSEVRGKRPLEAGRAAVAFAIPAALVLLPQILFWQKMYGKPLVMTAQQNFMHWTHPQLLPMLFSTWQGAFLWCPLLLVGLAGIALLPRRDVRWALWAGTAIEIYVSAATLDWWGSDSFGPRRLVAVAPIAGLGLALVVARLASQARTAIAVGLVVIGSCWTVRLAQYNLAGSIPNNPGYDGAYKRHYAEGDPRTRPYELWDYARFAREIADAEKAMWTNPSR